jgi:gamma-glutamyltranspeptidase/glutathione hydrolase
VRTTSATPSKLATSLLVLAVLAQAPLAGAQSHIGRNGMISTSQPLASQAGLRILQKGGNAFDAAVAAAAVLAVVNPFMAGMGGVGGYALLHDSRSGETLALDFIGNAPRAATPDMYRGDRLWDFAKRATTGYLAPLVPGRFRRPTVVIAS